MNSEISAPDLNSALAKCDPPISQSFRRGAKLWRKMERYYADCGVYHLSKGCAEMAKMHEVVGESIKEHAMIDLIRKHLPTLQKQFSAL